MRIPAIRGLIRRRVLLNYRVDPAVVRELLPAGFEPKTHGGHAVAGVCLIRLESVRPKGAPGWVGISSENSAHRFAVTWTHLDGSGREGVFVSRRDTNSRLNSLAGGRVFPGVHVHSRFHVGDQNGRLSLRVMSGTSDTPLVDLDALETEAFPTSSIFSSLEESLRFFEAGSIGYSSRPGSRRLDGLSLKVEKWRVKPLDVRQVRSEYFDDRSRFPAGSIGFDHALLMRDIVHEWRSEPEFVATPTAA